MRKAAAFFFIVCMAVFAASCGKGKTERQARAEGGGTTVEGGRSSETGAPPGQTQQGQAGQTPPPGQMGEGGESGQSGLQGERQPQQKGQPQGVQPAQPSAPTAAKPPEQQGAQAGGDQGVGPVRNLSLGPVNSSLANQGQQLFSSRCAQCHDLNQAKVGPPLGNVISQTSPAYVMNMLLNTSGMEQQDPRVQQLLQKYQMKMPDPGLNQSQARAIVEYLRSAGSQPSGR